MAQDELVTVGRLNALWRYPVKSMLGEQVGAVDVGDGGLGGEPPVRGGGPPIGQRVDG